MDFDEYPPRSRAVNPLAALAAVLLLVCLGLSLLAYSAARTRNAEVVELRTDVAALTKRLRQLDGQSSTISGRLDTTEARLREKSAGIAPLAARSSGASSPFRRATGSARASRPGWRTAGFT